MTDQKTTQSEGEKNRKTGASQKATLKLATHKTNPQIIEVLSKHTG